MTKFISGIFIFIFCFNCSLSLYSSSNSLTLSFNKQRGFYDEAFVLLIASSDPKAIIKYTTDCSDPLSKTGKIYVNSLNINSTMIIKAIAYTTIDTSELVTQTYLFLENVKKQSDKPTGFPSTWGGSHVISADYGMDTRVINNPVYSSHIIDALKSLPSLSLSMDIDEWFNTKTGLYVGYPNSDITREKKISAEFIYADSEKNFLVNCGLQNQGGTSIVDWKVPKQSMRLLFKDQYGPGKLKKKIFPDSKIESINTLVIDGFLYSWLHPWDETQRITTLYFRDQLASNIQNSMGGISFHGIYVNVYINGLYWGMYDLHERPDEEFLAEYYNANPEDFDEIKHNQNTVVAGTESSYKALLEQARKGFTTNESLEEIKKVLDLPAFIDYMILNFYMGNFDWAHKNYYAAVNKNLNTGYKFYTWDAEHVMRYTDVSYNNIDKLDIGGPTEIHQLLKKNPEYRLMFADAFYKHTFNNGALTPENFEKSFLKLKNEIELAVILESARWGDYLEKSTGVVYTKNDHWIPEVNKVLEDYIPNRLDIVIEQLRSSGNLLFPSIMPPVFDKNQGKISGGETVSLINNNSVSGEIFYTLDGTDPRKSGGVVQGESYSLPIVINKTTVIKARFRKSSNNEWSALAMRNYIPDNEHDAVVFSEIMYNSGYNGLEFIELLNNADSEVNLKGYSFIDGIGYSFTSDLLLQPGKIVVLTNDQKVFKEAYSFSAYDNYSKNLNNGGETILLANQLGEIIDSVSYSNELPWPFLAEGNRRSLELINADNDNADALNWRPSEALLGSPGSYHPSGVSINSNCTPEFRVYPNPFTNGIYVQMGNSENIGYLTVKIYSYLGQLVCEYQPSNTQQIFNVDLSELKSGMYILKVIDKNNGIQLLNKSIIKL